MYEKTKKEVGEIGHIYTDENSCYSSCYAQIGISHLHTEMPHKIETHMIEAVNSSIRDMLARFNRKSKRFSKSYELLECTLLLFFEYKNYNVKIK